MVAIREFRIVLPFTMEEYRLAQLYMVAKYSAAETSGEDGDGVEILKNEPFEDLEKDVRGQYTHKIYHLANKLPGWLVSLVPRKALMLEEEAWNAYPKCTTVLRCPFFKNFVLQLETMHLPDRGQTENALKLDKNAIKKRQVEFLDIAMDPVDNYVDGEDPTKFRSEKTGRGPLEEGWQAKCEPVMTAYKVVTVDVPYWGFGTKLERFISRNAQRKVLLEGHRKCFCWMDEWFGLSLDDIRKMEAETAEHIARIRAKVNAKDTEDGEVSSPQETESAGEAVSQPDAGEAANEERRRSSVAESESPTTSRGQGGTPTLSRRASLVGPAVVVGISTLSASDTGESSAQAARAHSGAPPIPTHGSPSAAIAARSGTGQRPTLNVFNLSPVASPAGSPSLPGPHAMHHANGSSYSSMASPSELRSMSNSSMDAIGVFDEEDVDRCLSVLDRAIALALARQKPKPKSLHSKSEGFTASQSPYSTPPNGFPPEGGRKSLAAFKASYSISSGGGVGSKSLGSSRESSFVLGNGGAPKGTLAQAPAGRDPENLEHCVGVLDRAMAFLKGTR